MHSDAQQTFVVAGGQFAAAVVVVLLSTACVRSVTGYETLQTFTFTHTSSHSRHGTADPDIKNGGDARRLVPTKDLGSCPSVPPGCTCDAPRRDTDTPLLHPDASAFGQPG